MNFLILCFTGIILLSTIDVDRILALFDKFSSKVLLIFCGVFSITHLITLIPFIQHKLSILPIPAIGTTALWFGIAAVMKFVHEKDKSQEHKHSHASRIETFVEQEKSILREFIRQKVPVVSFSKPAPFVERMLADKILEHVGEHSENKYTVQVSSEYISFIKVKHIQCYNWKLSEEQQNMRIFPMSDLKLNGDDWSALVHHKPKNVIE